MLFLSQGEHRKYFILQTWFIFYCSLILHKQASKRFKDLQREFVQTRPIYFTALLISFTYTHNNATKNLKCLCIFLQNWLLEVHVHTLIGIGLGGVTALLLHHAFFSSRVSVDNQQVSQCDQEEGDEEEENASPGPWGQSLHQSKTLCWYQIALAQHVSHSPAYRCSPGLQNTRGDALKQTEMPVNNEHKG